MNFSKEKIVKNQNGQTFIEFILLLVMLVTISFSFMRGFKYLIGSRWEVMVQIIAKPTDSSEIALP